MKMAMAVIAAVAAVVTGPAALGAGAADGGQAGWPAWRGPEGTGVARDATPPLRWSEGSNVLWKTPIPGTGHSSPVVWGDRVYVTTAIDTGKPADPEVTKAAEQQTPEWARRGARLPQTVIRFAVLALRRSDGRVLWNQSVNEEVPHAGTHGDGSWASASPVTDGERVYAFFGSYGLYCLDAAGKTLWAQRFGAMKVKSNFGEGASPALYGDTLLVNWDQEGPSFLAALDKRTGKERWRVPRDEATSWATPIVVEQDGKPQAIVSATKRIRGYDLATGKLLWECGGMTGNVIPCPVAAGGVVYCMSGFRGSALVAIRLAAAAGDITGKPEAIAWSYAGGTPYVPSPLLYDGLLVFPKVSSGVLTCLDAATGKPQYEGQALPGISQIYASPVGAAGRVYVTGRNGVTLVLARGPAFEVLASNTLADSFSASAALVGRELYLRGHKSLYCIAER